MINNEKCLKEKEIFKHFAKVSPLNIHFNSIENRLPPEPDILCYICGKRPVAFEMVEIIDQNYGRIIADAKKIQSLLVDSYDKELVNGLSKMQKNISNASIHITYDPEVTLRKKEKIIPLIFKLLHRLSPSFVGTIPLENDPLTKIVKDINITRGEFNGPSFSVDDSTFLEDRPLLKVTEKFEEKEYGSNFPIELLAYYYGQPCFPAKSWLPEFRIFVKNNIGNSQFKRIWIYDTNKKEILFVYPAV